MTDSQLIEDQKAKQEAQDETKRYAHIVRSEENMQIHRYLVMNGVSPVEGKDIVDLARTHRFEVTSLCSYRFIPQNDPDGLDACQICMDVAAMIMRNLGE